MLKAEGWKRIVAYLIDFLIISVILRIIFIIFAIIYYNPYNVYLGFNLDYVVRLAPFLFINTLAIWIIYYCIIPVFWGGQTIGRVIFRIKVVNKNDTKMKFSDFLLRDILGFFFIVSILTSLCFLGPIINAVMLFGDKKTTIQDEIANSKMVDLSITATVDGPKELLNQENNSDYTNFYDDDF